MSDWMYGPAFSLHHRAVLAVGSGSRDPGVPAESDEQRACPPGADGTAVGSLVAVKVHLPIAQSRQVDAVDPAGLECGDDPPVLAEAPRHVQPERGGPTAFGRRREDGSAVRFEGCDPRPNGAHHVPPRRIRQEAEAEADLAFPHGRPPSAVRDRLVEGREIIEVGRLVDGDGAQALRGESTEDADAVRHLLGKSEPERRPGASEDAGPLPRVHPSGGSRHLEVLGGEGKRASEPQVQKKERARYPHPPDPLLNPRPPDHPRPPTFRGFLDKKRPWGRLADGGGRRGFGRRGNHDP